LEQGSKDIGLENAVENKVSVVNKSANSILPIFKVLLVAGANYMPLFLLFAKETKPKHPLKSKTENNKYKYTR